MVIGLGIDLCENIRIEKAYKKFSIRFLNRIFTNDEIEYCLKQSKPITHLTARFALKEAFIKALNIKRDYSISYKEVSLTGKLPGKKNIQTTGRLKQMLQEKNIQNITFSISHTDNYSVATVLFENTHE